MARMRPAVLAMLLPAAALSAGQAAPAPDLPGAAKWIAAPDASADATGPMPIFRRAFDLKHPVREAALCITGLGQYEARIDGKNVTDAVLSPGWTDYRKRVLYSCYDVTRMLGPGAHAIGVMLGNGMYNVPETPHRYTKFTGSFGVPKMIASLTATYTDGSVEHIETDEAWKTAPGPIVFSHEYGGEDYDARREQAGWDRPSFEDARWRPAAIVNGPGGRLERDAVQPIRPLASYAVRVSHPTAHGAVYDLGQNLAGWPEILVHGHRGDVVRLIAGELLDAQGRVTQHSANASPDAPNAFTYTLRGDGEERWHPRFSYYGFRYVEAELQGAPVIDRLAGRAVHEDVAVDGRFTTSSLLFTRIHRLIDRAIESNMMSVLTDCPHREKLGWLEQTHLNAASLIFNYDLAALYAKMSNDMEDAQLASGMVPDIAPEVTVFEGPFRDSPEWGSAVILSPWYAYQFYGDLAPLRAHYVSMQRYAAYLASQAEDHMLSYGLGDWYDIGPKPPGESQLTGKSVTATATYYQDLTALARIAELLGKTSDAARYRDDAEAVKAAFNRRLFHPETDLYDRGSQTALAMPLVAGLVPEEHRAAVLANLVRDIRTHRNHVTAGDVGFHYVMRALEDNGRSDVLYDMLTRTDRPSYGDQLRHGATALTEAWDSNPNSSQNHFMLGHAEEWFYRGLAGIRLDMDRPADEQIRIEPAVVGRLARAGASYRSRLGEIESRWVRTGPLVSLTVQVPQAATVVLPVKTAAGVTLDARRTASPGSDRVVRDAAGGVAYRVGAGVHRFTFRPDVLRGASGG